MPNITATELFGNWVDLGKDEGMEKGHNSSVEFMISKALERLSGRFTCIDLGCGNGWTVRKIAKLSNCSESSGVDGSNRMISKAKQLDPDGEYYHAKLPNWTPPNPVNLIHSMEFIYYLEDPINFLKDLHNNWLTKGGCLILGLDHYIENESSLSWPESLGLKLATFSSEVWKDGLRDAGFSDVASYQVGETENWAGTLVLIGTKT